MTAFIDDESNWSRLDYKLIRDGGISLYYSRSVLENDLDWFRKEHYIIHDFFCDRWRTDEDFHTEVSQILGFPGYYGQNLNAFNDCLCDIEVPDIGGMVLLFWKADSFISKQGELMWNILDILAGACREELMFGHRMIILLQSDDPNIYINPVGARGVSWNPAEWLNSKRGL